MKKLAYILVFPLVLLTGCNSAYWKKLEPGLVDCGKDTIVKALPVVLPLVMNALAKTSYEDDLDNLKSLGLDTLFCAVQSVANGALRGQLSADGKMQTVRAKEYLATKFSK